MTTTTIPADRPLWRATALATVAAAAAAEALGLAARGLGVPMKAADPGAAVDG